jgi:CRP/FNR family transcriptional regulator, cyclic AMP receptor protein
MAIAWENVPIFAGLSAEALQFLGARAKAAQCAEGETIVREGESGNRMFIVRSGAVQVLKNASGDALEIARLQAGDFFGEMCILETLPRAATIRALAATEFDSLSSLAFYELFKSMPDQYSILVLNIARDLSRRLRRLDEIFAARS